MKVQREQKQNHVLKPFLKKKKKVSLHQLLKADFEKIGQVPPVMGAPTKHGTSGW